MRSGDMSAGSMRAAIIILLLLIALAVVTHVRNGSRRPHSAGAPCSVTAQVSC